VAGRHVVPRRLPRRAGRVAWFATEQAALVVLTDFIAPLVPTPGSRSGRLGNFVHSTAILAGVRPSDMPWAMVFPQKRRRPVAPTLLSYMSSRWKACCCSHCCGGTRRKPRPVGALSGMFLIGYGSFRFLVEFTREPARPSGLLSLGMSMGQWLSLPMVIAGILLVRYSQPAAPILHITARSPNIFRLRLPDIPTLDDLTPERTVGHPAAAAGVRRVGSRPRRDVDDGDHRYRLNT